jgi:hypothetical protein
MRSDSLHLIGSPWAWRIGVHHSLGEMNVEILWLELKESRTFKRGRGVLRIFAGYCGNTRFPQPIQY